MVQTELQYKAIQGTVSTRSDAFQGEEFHNLPQAYIILKMAAVNGEEAAMDASSRVTANERERVDSGDPRSELLFRNYLTQLREEQLRNCRTACSATDLHSGDQISAYERAALENSVMGGMGRAHGSCRPP
jgi:hypothetical protein